MKTPVHHIDNSSSGRPFLPICRSSSWRRWRASRWPVREATSCTTSRSSASRGRTCAVATRGAQRSREGLPRRRIVPVKAIRAKCDRPRALVMKLCKYYMLSNVFKSNVTYVAPFPQSNFTSSFILEVHGGLWGVASASEIVVEIGHLKSAFREKIDCPADYTRCNFSLISGLFCWQAV